MDLTVLAKSPYFKQVRAECPICGQVVKVVATWPDHLNGLVARIHVVEHRTTKFSARDSTRVCRGSYLPPMKYITVPCPECRKIRKSRNVPTRGRAWCHGLCQKHDRKQFGPLSAAEKEEYRKR